MAVLGKSLSTYGRSITAASGGPTINVLFDNDTYGFPNGSWAVQPSSVIVSSGVVSYPLVGFADQATLDKATATVNQFVSDFRMLCASSNTAVIGFNVGFGRKMSAFNFSSLSSGFQLDYSSAGSFALNNSIPFPSGSTTLDYATYRSLVANFPYAEEQAAYPSTGNIPFGAGSVSISVQTKTLYAGSGSVAGASQVIRVGLNPFYAWDWEPDTTTCIGGAIKAYLGLWHEMTQQFLRFGDGMWPNFLAYISSGVNWTSTMINSQTPYNSIDLGVTNLGNSNGATGWERFDYPATGDPTIVAPSAFRNQTFFGNAGVPGTAGNAGTCMQIPGGNKLPLRAPEDAKLLFGLVPASSILRTLAGF